MATYTVTTAADVTNADSTAELEILLTGLKTLGGTNFCL
jgi:hypothetical protein